MYVELSLLGLKPRREEGEVGRYPTEPRTPGGRVGAPGPPSEDDVFNGYDRHMAVTLDIHQPKGLTFCGFWVQETSNSRVLEPRELISEVLWMLRLMSLENAAL